eukprot:TRINITY_DN1790_c1_g1_i1.p1 TRINITY_DN1790_c1_g1~~TRINITY_DN1790_c1_g1_i1.p1  ORF type:complete len:614 (+),score=179.04 TRINITY_DN1790_c1_g1_i1:259-1842(+)
MAQVVSDVSLEQKAKGAIYIYPTASSGSGSVLGKRKSDLENQVPIKKLRLDEEIHQKEKENALEKVNNLSQYLSYQLSKSRNQQAPTTTSSTTSPTTLTNPLISLPIKPTTTSTTSSSTHSSLPSNNNNVNTNTNTFNNQLLPSYAPSSPYMMASYPPSFKTEGTFNTPTTSNVFYNQLPTSYMTPQPPPPSSSSSLSNAFPVSTDGGVRASPVEPKQSSTIELSTSIPVPDNIDINDHDDRDPFYSCIPTANPLFCCTVGTLDPQEEEEEGMNEGEDGGGGGGGAPPVVSDSLSESYFFYFMINDLPKRQTTTSGSSSGESSGESSSGGSSGEVRIVLRCFEILIGVQPYLASSCCSFRINEARVNPVHGLCDITSNVVKGVNKMEVQYAHIQLVKYFIAIQHMTKRSIDMVIKSVPLSDTETSKCVVMSTFNMEDSEVASTSVTVSCIDSVTLKYIKYPVRSSSCEHCSVFDLEPWLIMHEKDQKWICPICNKVVRIDELYICGFLKDVFEAVYSQNGKRKKKKR